jgi:hypothetical protein
LSFYQVKKPFLPHLPSFNVVTMAGGQEIEFHEIKTGGQKFCKIFMRSKFSFCKIIQEIEKAIKSEKNPEIMTP